jgi:hypothetical protein
MFVSHRARASVDITDRLFSEFSTRNDETIMSVSQNPEATNTNKPDKNKINSKLLNDLLEESVSYDNRQSLTADQQNQRPSMTQQPSRQPRTKHIEQSPSTLDISSYTSDSLYNSHFVLTPLLSQGALEIASNFPLNSPSHAKESQQQTQQSNQQQQPQHQNINPNMSLPMPSPSTSATLPSPPTFLNQHHQISSPTATYTSTSPLPPPPPLNSNVPPPPPFPFNETADWPKTSAPSNTNQTPSQLNTQHSENSSKKSGLKKVKPPAKNSKIQVLAERLALGGNQPHMPEEPVKTDNYGRKLFIF